jgi:DNA polymerase IV (DinB-like DNA polymerase)
LSNRAASYNNNNNKLHDDKLLTNTPHNFRFTIKLPKHIIEEDTYKVGDYLEELAPLEQKVLAVVIESPSPSKVILGNGGREWLDDILRTCTYHGYSVAFEFNHSSWFQDLTYNLLHRHKAAVVWSNFSSRYSYPIVTADFLYLRINGNEQKWIEKVKEKERELNGGSREEALDFAIVIVDNPAKANHILGLLDLPEKKYGHGQRIGKVIMHIDLNSFFPSCEELRDPALKGKPHAVIMTDQSKDNMSLFTAKQLCPQLILNPVDKSYY